jgi:hypothetical protein
MAQDTKKALEDVDGKTIHTYSIEHIIKSIETQVKGGGSADNPSDTAFRPGTFARDKATGGRMPGYADGGQLPTTGPGTGVTDGFLGVSSAGIPMARVDAGEWIIKRDSSQRYNRELAAINAGTFPKLPGYANGGRSREYSPQSLGFAPAGVNVMQAPVYVQNPFTGDYLLAQVGSVASGVVQAADSQSQFSRRGR